MYLKLIEKHKGLRRYKTYFAVQKDENQWLLKDHQGQQICVSKDKLILVLEEDHFPISAYEELVFDLLVATHIRGYEVLINTGTSIEPISEGHLFHSDNVYVSTGKPTARAKVQDNKALLRRINELKNQIKTLEEKIDD